MSGGPDVIYQSVGKSDHTRYSCDLIEKLRAGQSANAFGPVGAALAELLTGLLLDGLAKTHEPSLAQRQVTR